MIGSPDNQPPSLGYLGAPLLNIILIFHSLFTYTTNQYSPSAYIMPAVGAEVTELDRPGPFSWNLLSKDEVDNRQLDDHQFRS